MKQTIVHHLQREYKHLNKNIRNFKLSRNLKEEVENARFEKETAVYELEKLKKEFALIQKRGEGFKQAEKRLLNGEVKLTHSKTTDLLKEEIKRLMQIVTLQEEIIAKEILDPNSIVNVTKPRLQPHKNPFRLLKNYLSFRKELTNYHHKVLETGKAEFNLNLEKTKDAIILDKLHQKSYKSEHLKENSSSVLVGDTYKRVYYLADIPAYLSPYIFFRLLTSSLPFSLSIFIEPSPSSELLKKAKQRLSVLEMQQNDRLRVGKIRDQQIDKNTEEVSSFIDELVHETEKGFSIPFTYNLRLKMRKKWIICINSLKTSASLWI